MLTQTLNRENNVKEMKVKKSHNKKEQSNHNERNISSWINYDLDDREEDQ